jgi:hypothetical protein
MNHWAFVAAAYVVTGLGTALLLGWAYLSMRSAEATADTISEPE